MEIERERECKNTLKTTFKSMYKRIKKLEFLFFQYKDIEFLKYKNFEIEHAWHSHARENLFISQSNFSCLR